MGHSWMAVLKRYLMLRELMELHTKLILLYNKCDKHFEGLCHNLHRVIGGYEKWQKRAKR